MNGQLVVIEFGLSSLAIVGLTALSLDCFVAVLAIVGLTASNWDLLAMVKLILPDGISLYPENKKLQGKE